MRNQRYLIVTGHLGSATWGPLLAGCAADDEGPVWTPSSHAQDRGRQAGSAHGETPLLSAKKPSGPCPAKEQLGGARPGSVLSAGTAER